jgi:hypothetical protein
MASSAGTSSPSSRTATSQFGTPAKASDLDAADLATIRNLNRARNQYAAFVERAGSDATYADAVERSRQRMVDIDETIRFLKRGIAERRAARD